MSFTLGSLFDGSGGFPLAAALCGGTPLWASEIEPYPIAVTKNRFPQMKHLGSVTDINGAEIDPVDVITFGSPCQDLSIAGKRAGLKHETNGDEETTRSGLFMEAVRIIKEMREATDGKYPTFALWENVPGAFSSNKGEDFRIVLEELIKIVEPSASMPPVPKKGWPYADHYCGDGWSLAYRVFDAQFWGVPQRRRRIYLVLDLGGQRAGQVLFEREGLRGYFETGRAPWKVLARDVESGVGADDREGAVPYLLKIRSGCEGGGKGALIQTDMSATLSTLNDQYLFQPIVDGHILDDQGGSQISVRTDGKSPTLRAEMHGNVPCVMESAGFKAGAGDKAGGIGYGYEVSPTLAAAASGTNQAPTACIKEQYLFENHSQDSRYRGPLEVCPMLPAQLGTGGNNQPFVVENQEPIPINDKATRYKGGGESRNGDGSGNGLGVGHPGDPSPTLTAGDRHSVCYGLGNGQVNQSFSEEQVGALNCMHDQQAVAYGVDVRNLMENPELFPTIQAKSNGGQSLNYSGAVRTQYIVRRLTPTECARLQGFPDQWGELMAVDAMNQKEYQFWLTARNTHAAINDKAVKEYTVKQMLSWYNKLWTDSSEYKMWGNGIALPTALYCLQGIADTFN